MTTELTVDPRPLGRTGRHVSPLGYGSVPVGREGYPYADAERLLNALLDAGITLIDTAAAYGDAEEVIGRAVAHRRDEFTLVTKTGAGRGYVPAWSAPEIEAAIDDSLRKLRTEVLDVVLLHTCDLEILRRGEALAALQRAKELGKTRWIGYSGDNEALDHAIDLGVFDVVEASYSLLDQVNRDSIRRAAAAGLGVLLKRPIANAVPGRTTRPESEYAAEYWPRWQAMALSAEDVDGLPWSEAALRFAAFVDGAACALVGSGSLAHFEANIEALNRGALPPETVTRLEQRFDECAGNWPGLT
jgi:aryl-alcohol dehydrogenase-like predicted oxidoreductase